MDHPVTSTRSSDGIVNSLADTHEPGRELVSSERVWSGPIFAVDADQVRLGPGQEPVARQVVVHHDAVAVVALREGEASSQADGAAEILMIRQYRHPVRACLWEGQPLTIQEALRAGTAIVATDVGGTAVTARGGAVLVDPQAQAIVEALRTLLSEPEARTRAAERAQAAARRLPGLEDLAAQLRQTVLDLH